MKFETRGIENYLSLMRIVIFVSSYCIKWEMGSDTKFCTFQSYFLTILMRDGHFYGGKYVFLHGPFKNIEVVIGWSSFLPLPIDKKIK